MTALVTAPRRPDVHRLPTAGIGETLRVLAAVVGPQVAQGMVLRRPRVLDIAAGAQIDAVAARVLRRLRERHGGAPVRLAVPGREVAVVLSPRHVAEILAGTPEPFAATTREKGAALGHFGPHGVLVSAVDARPQRRRWNQRALQPGVEHPSRAVFASATRMHLGDLGGGVLDWPTFERAWRAVVRRVVLGASAATDEQTTDLLRRLRRRANWAHLARRRRRDRSRLEAICRTYLDRAEPGSLAAELARATAGCPHGAAEIAGQLPHWLFAFDAAGIAAYRTLALLADHPMHLPGARAVTGVPWLQAAVLEAVRLWPTTLSILRETTVPLEWNGYRLAAGTTLIVPSSFFTRDPARPYADLFAPSIWLDGTAQGDPGLIPFSAGPAACPGREVATLVAALGVQAIVQRWDLDVVDGPVLAPDRPLPATLDHTSLRLRLHARS
ncbi:MAG: cytochrome P450 [Sporichthyaceae bacterium]